MQLNIKSTGIFKETCNGNCYKNGKILLIVASGGIEISCYSIKFVRVMFVIYSNFIYLLGLYNNFAKTWIRNYYSRKLAISVFIIFEFCLYHKLFFERPLCKLIVYTMLQYFVFELHIFSLTFFQAFCWSYLISHILLCERMAIKTEKSNQWRKKKSD